MQQQLGLRALVRRDLAMRGVKAGWTIKSPVARPNRKSEERLMARIRGYETTLLSLKGKKSADAFTKPGSRKVHQ
jgi:hypothetical protein